MYKILHFILTCIVIFILSKLVSFNNKQIKIKYIIKLLLIEIIIAYFIIQTNLGITLIKYCSFLFNTLLYFANKGTDFVFGNMNNQGLAYFFLNVLCPIIFMSSIIGILQYIRILPWIIKFFGTALSKINGMGKLESFNAISSLILGQSENFIIYKNILHKLNKYQLYTMTITAMSTVSMSIIGSYMKLLEPKFVVAALILNIFSTFIIILILNPYSSIKKTDLISLNFIKKNQNFFEIICEHILIGFKLTMLITAMLIGFIALISAINAICIFLFYISFQDIISYLFWPLAWVIGIPLKETLQASSIMATKLVTNEFIAMIYLKNCATTLSTRSTGILSVFLVSFANFSSVGMLIGAIKGLNKQQGTIISNYGIKLVFSSTLVSILTSAIIALII